VQEVQTRVMMVISTWKSKWKLQLKKYVLIHCQTSFYFSPATSVGSDFKSSYVGFQEGFQEPFGAHVKHCFHK
jgi:hypothetical protein